MQIRKKLSALLFTAVLACAVGTTAYAHAVPDRTKDGSCQVKVTMQREGTPVPGGSVALYQAGEVQEEDGNYGFVLTKVFQDSGVSLENLGKQEDAELAAALASYAKAQSISKTAIQTVGEDGTASFENLPFGLYLVVQEQAAEGYYEVSPFLVSVPLYVEEKGEYLYAVDASPKVEDLKEKPEEPAETEEPKEEDPAVPGTPSDNTGSSETGTPAVPTTPVTPTEPVTPVMPALPTLPQTGQLNWPVPVLVVCGLVLFSAGWAMRYGKKKEGHEK